jgi:hypothetical protein
MLKIIKKSPLYYSKNKITDSSKTKRDLWKGTDSKPEDQTYTTYKKISSTFDQ